VATALFALASYGRSSAKLFISGLELHVQGKNLGSIYGSKA
jgi:hypothetical protein